MDTHHDLVVGSMRLSTMAIVDIVEHEVTTLKDGGVGSHQSCQIRILFLVLTCYLNPLSKIDLAAITLFHAKLPELVMGHLKRMYWESTLICRHDRTRTMFFRSLHLCFANMARLKE